MVQTDVFKRLRAHGHNRITTISSWAAILAVAAVASIRWRKSRRA